MALRKVRAGRLQVREHDATARGDPLFEQLLHQEIPRDWRFGRQLHRVALKIRFGPFRNMRRSQPGMVGQRRVYRAANSRRRETIPPRRFNCSTPIAAWISVIR